MGIFPFIANILVISFFLQPGRNCGRVHEQWRRPTYGFPLSDGYRQDNVFVKIISQDSSSKGILHLHISRLAIISSLFQNLPNTPAFVFNLYHRLRNSCFTSKKLLNFGQGYLGKNKSLLNGNIPILLISSDFFNLKLHNEHFSNLYSLFLQIH